MLPQEIFITHEREDEDEDGGWLSASRTAKDAVEGSNDETPVVGRYKLVEERALELVRTVRVRQPKKSRKGE